MRKHWRRELARLFPGAQEARLLSEDAGLDLSRIGGESETPEIRWNQILKEAENAGKLDRLLAEAADVYPDAIRRLLSGATPGESDRAGTTAVDDDLAPPSSHPGSPPVPPAFAPLETLGGTLDPDSPYYVTRPVDEAALRELALTGGRTMTLKGPRQVGKSSLLARAVAAARAQGKRVVYLDFQSQVSSEDLVDADRFFPRFCASVSDALELEDRTDDPKLWATKLSNPQRCTNYLARWVLKQADGPLVLAMDEADRLFAAPFYSDFFGMVRAWHNGRAMEPVWKRLDLVLVTSTEPQLFIQNPNQSPFNVGLTLPLEDFGPDQVADLNGRHGGPLSAGQSARLATLTHGHPYLVRQALYLAESGMWPAARLLEEAATASGPFSDHLQRYLSLVAGHAELEQGLLEVIRHKRCRDGRVRLRLLAAGLVRDEGRETVARCPIYATFFEEHLHG